MRIGIDLRCLQFSEVQRGYGQYVRSILLGISRSSPTEEIHLFKIDSRPLATDLLDLVPDAVQVPLHTPPTWRETGSFWSRSRSQLIPYFPGRAKFAYLAAQGREIDKKAKELRLDLYFVPAPMFPDQGTLSELSVPSVFAFHDSIPFRLRNRYIDEWDVDARKLYLLQRAAYKSATRVAAVSQSARDDAVQQFELDPNRVDVALNSMDCQFGEPVEGAIRLEVRRKFRLLEPYFVFCSILDYHKNIETVVSALALMNDSLQRPHRLAVIGGLPEKQKEKVRALAFDAGLTGRDVIMTGHISELELRALYQSAVAVLSPSIAEGFGFPVLQALLSRVPVLAADIPPFREILGQVGCRLPPQDVLAWATAMGTVVNEPEYGHALTREGELIAAKFAPESQGRQLIECFRKAVSHS